MKVKKEKEKNETCANRIEMFDFIKPNFFRVVCLCEHTFTQTGNTHTH